MIVHIYMHLHILDINPKIVKEDGLACIVVSREWFCCVLDLQCLLLYSTISDPATRDKLLFSLLKPPLSD